MKVKKLGIWMDHQNAHLMEFTTDPIETRTLQSKFTHEVKELILHRGENRMHSKEQHQQAEYYKAIGKVIRDYETVVLFGPTDAKTELFNLLTADNRYAKIIIDVKQADKMTEDKQHTFVKEYFSAHHLS